MQKPSRWWIAVLTVLLIGAGAAAQGPEPTAPPRSNRGSSAVRPTAPPALPPAAAAVSVEASRALGSPHAKLALIEFADYQCPYCRDFDGAILPRIVQTYVKSGVVRYFHKDFPLVTHPQAFAASVAARCAAQQGQYWTMHRRLYQAQERLGDGLYEELAEELGLDRARFGDCRNSRAVRLSVQRDIAEGRAIGVGATPTFALGRIEDGRVSIERIARGALSFEEFAREIEKLRRDER